MQGFFLFCYVFGCLLFLVDGICRIARPSREGRTFNSTWMTPIGAFFVFLPALITAFQSATG